MSNAIGIRLCVSLSCRLNSNTIELNWIDISDFAFYIFFLFAFDFVGTDAIGRIYFCNGKEFFSLSLSLSLPLCFSEMIITSHSETYIYEESSMKRVYTHSFDAVVANDALCIPWWWCWWWRIIVIILDSTVHSASTHSPSDVNGLFVNGMYRMAMHLIHFIEIELRTPVQCSFAVRINRELEQTNMNVCCLVWGRKNKNTKKER